MKPGNTRKSFIATWLPVGDIVVPWPSGLLWMKWTERMAGFQVTALGLPTGEKKYTIILRPMIPGSTWLQGREVEVLRSGGRKAMKYLIWPVVRSMKPRDFLSMGQDSLTRMILIPWHTVTGITMDRSTSSGMDLKNLPSSPKQDGTIPFMKWACLVTRPSITMPSGSVSPLVLPCHRSGGLILVH